MSQSAFALGVRDARAGLPYHAGYDNGWDVDSQWDYERGRQWARLAPRDMPLRCNGKLNPEAIGFYGAEIR